MGDQIQCHQTKPQLQDCIKTADQYSHSACLMKKEPSNPWVLIECCSKKEQIFLFSLHSPILRHQHPLVFGCSVHLRVKELQREANSQGEIRQDITPWPTEGCSADLGFMVHWSALSSMILKMSFACPCSLHNF